MNNIKKPKRIFRRINHRILKKYFLSFYMFIIIPVMLIAAIIYFFPVRIIQTMEHNSNNRILNSASNMVDDRLMEFQKLIYNLSDNYYIYDFFTKQNIYNVQEDIITSAKILKEFSNTVKMLNFIDDIYLYVHQQNYILSYNYGKHEFENFFGSYNIYDGLDIEQVRNFLKTPDKYKILKTYKVTDKNMTYTNNTSKNIITVKAMVPLIGTKMGTCVININEDIFFRSLKEDSLYAGDIIVLNEQEEIVSHIGNKFYNISDNKDFLDKIKNNLEGGFNIDIDGIKAQVTFITSDYNSWKYIAVISTKELLKKSTYIRNISIFTCSLISIIGILISFLMSRRIYKPIKSINERLNEHLKQKDENPYEKANEFSVINKSLNAIFSENNRLTNEYNENKELVLERFLYGLIKGFFSSETELEELAQKLELTPGLGIMVPILINIDWFKNFNKETIDINKKIVNTSINTILKDTLKNKFDGIIIKLDDIQYFGILCYSTYSEEVVKYAVNGILKEIEIYFEYMNVTIAVGNNVDSYRKFEFSYKILNGLIENRLFGETNQALYLWDMELDNEHEEPVMINERKQMKNSLMNGDYAFASSLLTEILKKHRKSRLKYKYAKIYFMDILNIVFETIESLNILVYDIFENYHSLFKELEECCRFEEVDEFANNIFSKVTQYICNQKGKNENIVVKDMLEYMRENYDKQMYLELMAEKMGMSSGYFSRYFKEKVGEYFVDYLNKVRLNKAKEMLIKTDLKIKDISQCVGYLSCNTFNVVFKKYEGISPGTFKKNNVFYESK